MNWQYKNHVYFLFYPKEKYKCQVMDGFSKTVELSIIR